MKKIIYKNSLSRYERKVMYKSGCPSDRNGNKIVILMAITGVSIKKGKLGFNRSTRDGDFITKSKAILEALTLNTGGYFSPPFGDMDLLESRIDALTTAILNVSLHVLGAGGAKVEAKVNVYSTLLGALDYINQLARNKQNAATEIITGAKMLEVIGHTYNKPDFSVKQGPATGEVILHSRPVKIDNKIVKTGYEWQRSIDGGVTWIDIVGNQRSKISVTGLAVGVAMKFRKRTTTFKGGVSSWCTAIDFIVQ